MPRAHIVLAHPEPTSFNGHLAGLARGALQSRDWQVSVTDLAAIGFDPREDGRHYAARADAGRFDAQLEQRHASELGTLPADVAAELAHLEAADLLILQFPMWWHSVPAILKGWFDRVLVYGGVYTSKMRYDNGLYNGKRAIVSVTTGAPASTFAYNGRSGDIDLLLWPTHFSLAYVGYTVLEPFKAFGVEGVLRYSADEVVRERLAGYARDWQALLDAVESRATIPFNGFADWDATGRLKPGVRGHSPFMRDTP